jgi:hypothetical protein
MYGDRYDHGFLVGWKEYYKHPIGFKMCKCPKTGLHTLL